MEEKKEIELPQVGPVAVLISKKLKDIKTIDSLLDTLVQESVDKIDLKMLADAKLEALKNLSEAMNHVQKAFDSLFRVEYLVKEKTKKEALG